jgi:hypothetical protein
MNIKEAPHKIQTLDAQIIDNSKENLPGVFLAFIDNHGDRF